MPEIIPHKPPMRPKRPLTYRQASHKMWRSELRKAMTIELSKINDPVEFSRVYSTIAQARAIRAGDLRETAGEGGGVNFSTDKEYNALNERMKELENRKRERLAEIKKSKR